MDSLPYPPKKLLGQPVCCGFRKAESLPCTLALGMAFSEVIERRAPQSCAALAFSSSMVCMTPIPFLDGLVLVLKIAAGIEKRSSENVELIYK